MAEESAAEDSDDSGGSLLVAGFGVVLVLIGVGIAVGASLSAISAMQAADAGVETEGTVVSTDIVEEFEESDPDDDNNQDTERVYYAQVTYNYTVDGETYTSSTQKVPPLVTEPKGEEFETQSGAETYLRQYAPGSSLTVYYMPDDPAQSYFEEPDYSLVELALPFGFGLPFAVVGLVIVLWSLGIVGADWGSDESKDVWTAEDDEALEAQDDDERDS